MEARESCTIAAKTQESHCTRTTFVDADVDMPILSVAQISANGNDFYFNKSGGVITDSKTGVQSKFVKRRGVYFIKLFVDKQLGRLNNLDFVRPGVP